MDLFHDRRPAVADDHEWPTLNESPLDRAGLRSANTRLRNAAKTYELDGVNRKIRTAAVQRHRARRAGSEDYSSMGEYLSFMTGADHGGK